MITLFKKSKQQNEISSWLAANILRRLNDVESIEVSYKDLTIRIAEQFGVEVSQDDLIRVLRIVGHLVAVKRVGVLCGETKVIVSRLIGFKTFEWVAF